MANPTPDIAGSQFHVSMEVEGEDYGFCKSSTGLEATRESIKIKPGAMTPEVTLPGGTMSMSNATLTYPYDSFHRARIPALMTAGMRKAVIVKQFPLDVNGVKNGPAIIVPGTMIRAKAPDYDSDSTEAAMCEYELDFSGNPTTA